nr:MAG TPA: hypothetical protein [Caudoviricetes sp.]
MHPPYRFAANICQSVQKHTPRVKKELIALCLFALRIIIYLANSR